MDWSDALAPGDGDTVIDLRSRFVMPGLADAHTHLSYGNARSEEEVDLYGSLEYRTLRALSAAQRMLRAGYTALLDPACAGLVTPALRDALFVGMFPGPRITTAGPALTTRQGLYDYYPSWIGVPAVSTGVLVRSVPEAIEEVRRQTKEGVDAIKLAMDGIQGDARHGLYAAFDQDETTAIVREAKRLGRLVVVHARGSEGALYAARAGVDVIYHASRIDDEGIRAALGEGCFICPSLLLLVNNIEYARPDDPSYDWWPRINRRELADAKARLVKAYEAGVRFLVGSESGFAVTPYGEWAAKELTIMAEHLGIPNAAMLRMATTGNRAVLRDGAAYESLSPGKRADFIAVDGDPLEDPGVLFDEARPPLVWMDGRSISLPAMPMELPRHPREASQGFWNRTYTRAAVRDAETASTELDFPKTIP